MRMTPARITATVVVVGALLLAVGVGAFAPRPGTELFVGSYGPDRGIVVKNLTVGDGYYLVGYSMDVFVTPNPGSVGVECDLQDISGRLAELPGLVRPVASGTWVTITAQNVLELPDATLGIRCFAQRDALLEISVRNVTLTAQRGD